MIKIILFDIDGVLINSPHYFPVELERNGYIGAEKEIEKFYINGDNNKCNEGKADELKLIFPYLKNINWEKSSEDYFNEQYQFEKKHLDEQLLSMIEGFQKKSIKCFTCTDQTRHRAKFLLNEMNFQNIFDGQLISCFEGYRKCHDEFWINIFKKLKTEFNDIKKEEIVFFDDIQNNIDTAEKFGIKGFLFTNLNKFEKDIKKINL
jgi:FMN phosphatase YigB (HAD superfamily)